MFEQPLFLRALQLRPQVRLRRQFRVQRAQAPLKP
jgi:hypothetical protein